MKHNIDASIGQDDDRDHWAPDRTLISSARRLPHAGISGDRDERPLRQMRPALGTFVEVGARGANAAAALRAAFAQIDLAQQRWSFHDPHSELSRLNARPGTWVAVSRPTSCLLRLARAMTELSERRFDCTVGGALVAAGALPDHGCCAALPRGEADDIEVFAGRARLRRPARLTLDGIAKGYAVDLAVAALRRCGARAGWVNAGGDLRVFGDIALPLLRREIGGRFAAIGALREGALATSAAMVESSQPDARFPARIIGPTGEPPADGTWTVLARSAWRADALTKVAANSPPAQRAAIVARLGGRLLEMTS